MILPAAHNRVGEHPGPASPRSIGSSGRLGDQPREFAGLVGSARTNSGSGPRRWRRAARRAGGPPIPPAGHPSHLEVLPAWPERCDQEARFLRTACRLWRRASCAAAEAAGAQSCAVGVAGDHRQRDGALITTESEGTSMTRADAAAAMLDEPTSARSGSRRSDPVPLAKDE